MRTCIIFPLVALQGAFSLALSAQELARPDTPKSEVQIRAEALLERARRASDIRKNGAAAFRLTATFSFTGRDLEKTQGTYTEVWVSKSQWRRETVVNDIHRIEVGSPNRRWLLDSSDIPDVATRLPDLMKVVPAANRSFDFESIDNATDQKLAMLCATTKPGDKGDRFRFCFDAQSGILIARLSPEIRPMHVVDHTCFYGMFRRFGDSWFPRAVSCFADKHHVLDVKIEDLALEPAPDTSLFVMPPGALEIGDCSGATTSSVATVSSELYVPPDYDGPEAYVALSLIVDAKGVPRNLRVKQSSAKLLGENALETVQNWRFKPATCDKEPMPEEIMLEPHFFSSKLQSGVVNKPSAPSPAPLRQNGQPIGNQKDP